MHELKICSTSHDKLKDGLTEHTSKKKRNKQTKGKIRMAKVCNKEFKHIEENTQHEES